MLLRQAPEELTAGPLRRLGEGIGKVVYASEHWVVRRERQPREIVALVLLWKLVRHLPRGTRWRGPSKRIRFLRVLIHAAMSVVPRGLWYTTHVRATWKAYWRDAQRGEAIAREVLDGTGLIPQRIEFPPVRVNVGRWPGWLTVSDAVERADATLHERLQDLADAGRYDELEMWLRRFLALRQKAWRQGVFSLDAHLKNYGVMGERIVLLDTGGLTDEWESVERKLQYEQSVGQPHARLGLAGVLAARPDIAERFNAAWKAIVTPEVVRECWGAD